MAEIASVPPPPPVKPGELVAGKYLVEHAVAEGGMGIVFAAKHLELDQAVALKVMRTELRGRISTKRFTLEARATAKLKSAHVARVFDVGVLESGTPFMIMELLDGQDLDALLQEEGRLEPIAAADLMVQACEAIAEAHEAGIIHRDLKPANLFVTRTKQGAPFVKVLDFGISKATIDGASAGGTAAGTIMGSPPYMSPEQLKSSNNCDARSDIWSLGVILYELVTGLVPFDGDGIGELALKVHHEEPKWPRELVPTVPEDFEKIIRRCLEKESAKRYASVAELEEDLVAFLATCDVGGAPISIRGSQPRLVFPRERVMTPKDADGAGETVAHDAAAAPVVTESRKAPRAGLHRVALGVAVAAVLGIAAFVVGTGPSARPVVAHAEPLPTQAAKAVEPAPPPAVVVTASASAVTPPPAASVVEIAKPKPSAPALTTLIASAKPGKPAPSAPPTLTNTPVTAQPPSPASTVSAVRDRGF